ncbi:MAG: glycosyltransferase [Thermoplasmata archaeon]|nr:glycosyltransferase [Thermoplasmata archaeon]
MGELVQESAGAGDPSSSTPWFSVTMTVRNNIDTIAESLGSILPLAGSGGEVVVVDALSTDGTKEFLDRTAAESPELVVVSRRCNRGIGRNLAVATARSPIVLTQVDGDNRYAPGAILVVAERLRTRPSVGLIFTVGMLDRDPSLTRFYAWRRPAFERTGGYPDVQEREDPPLLLRAFRAGFEIERFVLPNLAADLKPRPAGFAPNFSPWGRAVHTMWAARRFRVMGFRYTEYGRLLWLTRRTPARLGAGLVLGLLAYVQGFFARDGQEIVDRDVTARPPEPPTASTPSGASESR